MTFDKGPRTYCSGYSFAVGVKAAKELDLLNGKSPKEIKNFQKDWYITGEGADKKGPVAAMRNLGIGSQVDLRSARPGDFVQYWRKDGTGHSGVFMGWKYAEDGTTIVGMKFRSSQSHTGGIGDWEQDFYNP